MPTKGWLLRRGTCIVGGAFGWFNPENVNRELKEVKLIPASCDDSNNNDEPSGGFGSEMRRAYNVYSRPNHTAAKLQKKYNSSPVEQTNVLNTC